MGAASARQNEAGEPCASSHEESSKSVWVQQTGGGVAGTAQAATTGGHTEETAARGTRGLGEGRRSGVTRRGGTGEEEGAGGK